MLKVQTDLSSLLIPENQTAQEKLINLCLKILFKNN